MFQIQRCSIPAARALDLWLGQNSVPINSQSELSNTNYMRTISRCTVLIYLLLLLLFLSRWPMAAAVYFVKDI